MLAPTSELLATQGPVVSAIRARFPDALATYAFGSQVGGAAGPQRDWDLAVLVAGYADPLVLWDVSGSLANVLGGPVDLLDRRGASTAMQHQVIATSRRLWSAGLQAYLLEAFVLGEKTALGEARAIDGKRTWPFRREPNRWMKATAPMCRVAWPTFAAPLMLLGLYPALYISLLAEGSLVTPEYIAARAHSTRAAGQFCLQAQSHEWFCLSRTNQSCQQRLLRAS